MFQKASRVCNKHNGNLTLMSKFNKLNGYKSAVLDSIDLWKYKNCNK